MRKVDVVRPPINYAIVAKRNKDFQIAWFIAEEDALAFFEVMDVADQYEIAVRR